MFDGEFLVARCNRCREQPLALATDREGRVHVLCPSCGQAHHATPFVTELEERCTRACREVRDRYARRVAGAGEN